MLKHIKLTIKEFLELDSSYDYESLLANQDIILEQLQLLKQIESENQELLLDAKKTSYYDYLTLKNALLVLLFLGFIGGGFWFYNPDFFNNATLESIKSLLTLSKDLQINHQDLLNKLHKLNDNSVNLSKAEIQLLFEIKNLVLKKGDEQ